MAPLIVKQEITKPNGDTVMKAGLSPWAIIAAAIAGTLLALGGIAFDAVDVYTAVANKQMPHTVHLSIGLGVFVLGIVVAFGHFVLNPLYQLTVIVSNSSLPVIGGRRASDPPPPTTNPNDPAPPFIPPGGPQP